ncbi:uncharacterized protein LOC132035000 [Lycium ferocissimum]|uniref:uncharacterized protein LOC132035000 n=1 Tax=Lycium ferocissimum TaxID=112874 RepID=UPI0028164876|nr:uncharacterized protein LOC132035000 [Lycium ferocissimum]
MTTSIENTITEATSAGNGVVAAIDQSSLYFLHASDSPGMNLVNTPFDGTGYGAWRISMLIALSAKNKLGYIEKESVIPPSESAEYKLWSRCNDMVTSWLLNYLSKEIAGSVIYSKTAKELWKDLEDSCGGKEKMNKSLQDERLVQFLMGLNDVYAPGRSNILMLSPLPSVNLAYSLLMQDEK